MKRIIFIITIFLLLASYLKAQQDTIFLDQNTGNYTIIYTNDDNDLVKQTFIPWNKVNPSIKCNVEYKLKDGEFVYNWKIKNEKDSKQNLNYFILNVRDSSLIDRSTCGWWYRRLHKPDGLIRRYKWSGDQGLEPTWEVGGFSVGSQGLPSIGISYFQGSGGSILSFSVSPPPEKIMQKIAEIDGYPSGYIPRKTVTPDVIPFTLTPLEFIDTIKTYCDSSYSLGWIKEEPTLTKYNNYLTTAKNYLTEGDSSAARNELQLVLNDCVADSSTVLTSEAFALLYFNTEYLISQLPEGETYPYLKDKIKNPR